MRQRRYPGPILMAGLILLAATAWAGGERASSTAELVRAAQQVLHGQFSRKDVAADAKGRIWTTYTLEVRETLKAGAATGTEPAGSPHTFRQLGGTLGQITCRAENSPHFELGEKGIVFTKDYGAGSAGGEDGAGVVEFGEGILDISTDLNHGKHGIHGIHGIHGRDHH